MTYVAFTLTRQRRDNPEPFGTISVDDGPNRHWDVDVDQLLDARADKTIVLDTATDQPIIEALRDTKGLSEVKDWDAYAGQYRTLPDSLDDMNEAQLLSTEPGNEISEVLTDPDNPMDRDQMQALVEKHADLPDEERQKVRDATLLDKYDPVTAEFNPEGKAGDGDPASAGPVDIDASKGVAKAADAPKGGKDK